ncbi:MAG TPA: GDP-mannose 4,6-dehydratase, partial [Candidatus Kryptonia bacterium]|nr:GDP-mannose 4,6-dehydratase [Candidatus Kryptonia bacterium]
NAVVRQQAHIERFIHVSSSDVYGSAEREPIDESHPLNPTNPYAAAKAGADRLVYSYWRTFRIPAVIVRPFNVYGARQHVEKLIPRFITSLLLNEPLTVHGAGTAARDWLHVDDFCIAIDQLLQLDLGALEGQVFNIGSGVATDVLTIARRLIRLTGEGAARIEHIADRLGQVAKQVAGVERARALLRWEPRIELDTGLARTVKWYLDNRAWWEPLHRTRRAPTMAGRGSVALQ